MDWWKAGSHIPAYSHQRLQKLHKVQTWQSLSLSLCCAALWPGTPHWPPHILFPLRCCALCKRMCHLMPQAELGESLFGTLINVQLSWVFRHAVHNVSLPRPLFMPHDVAVCLQKQGKERRTDWQTDKRAYTMLVRDVPTRKRTSRTYSVWRGGRLGWRRVSSMWAGSSWGSRRKPCFGRGARTAAAAWPASPSGVGPSLRPTPSDTVLQPAEEAVAAPVRLSVAEHIVVPCFLDVQIQRMNTKQQRLASADV